MFYDISYFNHVVEDGLEPSTSDVSDQRSNQLSYPTICVLQIVNCESNNRQKFDLLSKIWCCERGIWTPDRMDISHLLYQTELSRRMCGEYPSYSPQRCRGWEVRTPTASVTRRNARHYTTPSKIHDWTTCGAGNCKAHIRFLFISCLSPHRELNPNSQIENLTS